MKRAVADLLICPTCLPREIPLECSFHASDGEDILAGALCCRRCRRPYPIAEGIAMLLTDHPSPAPKQALHYEEASVAVAYLWSHYADTFAEPEPEAFDAYGTWASALGAGRAMGLDAGCAVGRFTFEMSRGCELALGIDRSRTFIHLARQLAARGRLDFALPTEGRLSEPRTVTLPHACRPERTEFLIADALALPFPRAAFATLSSLNLIDRVERPRRHLEELCRVAAPSGARLLLSDPFSWNGGNAPPEEWLGGLKEGPFAGYGIDNIQRLLQEAPPVPWAVERTGATWWTIRNHRNHFERIRSEYLVARR